MSPSIINLFSCIQIIYTNMYFLNFQSHVIADGFQRMLFKTCVIINRFFFLRMMGTQFVAAKGNYRATRSQATYIIFCGLVNHICLVGECCFASKKKYIFNYTSIRGTIIFCCLSLWFGCWQITSISMASRGMPSRPGKHILCMYSVYK